MLSVLSIPNRCALYLAKPMDIREIRRQNLIALRKQFGSVREIADRVETDANYISQLLGGKGKYFMGHTMARRLEQACDKPDGWMDQHHAEQEYLDEDIEDIARLARKMDATQRKTLRSFMRSMISPNNPSAEAMPGKRIA